MKTSGKNSVARTVAAAGARDFTPEALRCLLGLLLLVAVCSVAQAQEPRYSWFEIGYIGQESQLTGTQETVPGQFVDIATNDGNGVRFRGSLDAFANFYVFGDYGSADLDDSAIVTNDMGSFPAEDEFDLTTIRAGLGYRIPLGYTTHIYGEVSWDSLDYDFGSFATEDFDTGENGFGAGAGIRSVFGETFEVRAYGRYTSVGTADLNALSVDDDALFGAGASWMFLRGLSISLDYEAGEINTWSVGFRLDLDED